VKKSVFISYRRDDSAGHTRALATQLKETFGADRIFLDVDDIRGGENFIQTIEQAGYATRGLLAVIGKHWLSAADDAGARRLDDPNDYVRAEIRTALERGIHVIPVLVGDAELPPAERLPADLHALTSRNAVEIRHARFKDDVEHLARDLQASLGLKRVNRGGTGFAGNVRRWLAVATAVVALGAFGLYVLNRPTPNADGLTDLFAVLTQQGYETNAGFSGNLEPGNIVRIAEAGPDGLARPLATPVVFMWASDCFPGQAPRRSAFVLPESEGRVSAALTLGSGTLRRWLPAFGIAESTASSYSLTLDDTAVQTFALGDLSGAFSDRCVRALEAAIQAGDAPGWFAIVVEAVVAEGLSMQVEWRSALDAGTRDSATEYVRDTLAQLIRSNENAAAGNTARVEAEDRRRTVIAADGPLIVAYRARPIQPRYAD
jgi:hypothetical protein